ncbi:unnamed protein product [Urochloa humidicola]
MASARRVAFAPRPRGEQHRPPIRIRERNQEISALPPRGTAGTRISITAPPLIPQRPPAHHATPRRAARHMGDGEGEGVAPKWTAMTIRGPARLPYPARSFWLSAPVRSQLGGHSP